jgi:hypothetical protein
LHFFQNFQTRITVAFLRFFPDFQNPYPRCIFAFSPYFQNPYPRYRFCVFFRFKNLPTSFDLNISGAKPRLSWIHPRNNQLKAVAKPLSHTNINEESRRAMDGEPQWRPARQRRRIFWLVFAN